MQGRCCPARCRQLLEQQLGKAGEHLQRCQKGPEAALAPCRGFPGELCPPSALSCSSWALLPILALLSALPGGVEHLCFKLSKSFGFATVGEKKNKKKKKEKPAKTSRKGFGDFLEWSVAALPSGQLDPSTGRAQLCSHVSRSQFFYLKLQTPESAPPPDPEIKKKKKKVIFLCLLCGFLNSCSSYFQPQKSRNLMF